MARPENAQVSSTLLPTAKEKEERMRCYKKRLEGLFYRMRKKLKQKADGAAATTTPTGGGDGPKAADGGSASASTVPAAPQTAATTAPTPITTGMNATKPTTTMTQQELENIAASRAFNEAIQSGSPFKAATEEAAAAAAAARANQNLPTTATAARTNQNVAATAAPTVLKSIEMEESPVIADEIRICLLLLLLLVRWVLHRQVCRS